MAYPNSPYDEDSLLSVADVSSSSTGSSNIQIPSSNNVYNISFTISSTDDQASVASSTTSRSRIEPNHLSLALNQHHPPLKRLASEWTNSYNEIQWEAKRSILELIIQSAGVMLRLDQERVQELISMNGSSIDLLMNHSRPNPFIYNTLYLKNLSVFLRSVLKETVMINCQFMESMMSLLSAMSESSFIVSRFTASMFVGNIVHIYCNFIEKLEREIVDASNDVGPTLLDNLNLIKGMLDKFLQFFCLFLRDSAPTTRKANLPILIQFFDKYPNIFMNYIYLRFVAWSIFDDDNSVRLKAIQICRSLFESDRFGNHLGNFADSVLPCLFRRTEDIVTKIAVEAVHTIIAINRLMPIIQGESLCDVFKLIYSDRDGVSIAAAQLLCDNLTKNYPDSKNFLNEVVIFLYESESVFVKYYCHESLAHKLMVHARRQLTDWQAWVKLLLEPRNPRLQSRACRLLLAVIQLVIKPLGVDKYIKYISPIFAEDYLHKYETEEKISKKRVDLAKKYQKELTEKLGAHLLKIWKLYKTNKNNLEVLIQIPIYFGPNIEKLDIHSLCRFLLLLNIHPESFEDKSFLTLVYLQRLMSSSPKWVASARDIKNLVSSKTEQDFLTIRNILEEDVSLSSREDATIKRQHFMIKHFDLSHTKLYDDVKEALWTIAEQLQSTSIESRNYMVYIHFAYLGVYMAIWRLKNLQESYTTSAKEIKSLHSFINTLDLVLKPLLCSINSKIKGPIVLMYCRMLNVFNAENLPGEEYKPLHYPLPKLLECEWLNFHLYTTVPIGRPLQGKLNQEADAVFCSFCSLLIIQAIPISYLTSILPYFARFHYEIKKSNYMLKKTIDILILREGAPNQLAESLYLLWVRMKNTVENISDGLCSVMLKNTKVSREQITEISITVLSSGFSKIVSQQLLPFMVALIPFVSLIPHAESEMLSKYVEGRFPPENEHVKRLLANLQGNLNSPATPRRRIVLF